MLRLLAGAATLPLAGHARAAPVPRFPPAPAPWIERRAVSLNWAVSETLYAMGIRPLGAVDLPGYARSVAVPPAPDGVSDIGLQGAPNMEMLAALAPEVILIQAWQQQLRTRLERCAPVESLTIFTGTGDAYAHAAEATRRVGDLLAARERSDALVQAADAALVACRARLTGYDGRPLYLAQVIDQRIVSLFTSGGLFQAMLERLGLNNAWRGAPNLLWGGTRVGLDRLAQVPEARLVLIGSSAMQGSLLRSDVWQALPAVKAGRVLCLEQVWAFGAVPSAVRFANALTAGLMDAPHG